MKKLLLTTFAAFGLMTSSSFAYTDCVSGCSASKCATSQDKWNECFDNCWRDKAGMITNCINAARGGSKVTKAQEFIMGYFSNGEKELWKFMQNNNQSSNNNQNQNQNQNNNNHNNGRR